MMCVGLYFADLIQHSVHHRGWISRHIVRHRSYHLHTAISASSVGLLSPGCTLVAFEPRAD
eukprot:10246769-Karenia_brevis.AAC.1